MYGCVCVCVCVEGLGLPHLPQFLLSCPLLFYTKTHSSRSETIKPTLALETPHPTTNQTNPPSRFPKHPRMQADEQESTGASRRCRDFTGQGAHNKSLCTLTHDAPVRAADPPMAHRPFPPLLQYTKNDFCACERARRPWVRRRVPKTSKNTAPKSCPQNAPPTLTSGRAAPSTVISLIRTR
jgi:hypothetical protein